MKQKQILIDQNVDPELLMQVLQYWKEGRTRKEILILCNIEITILDSIFQSAFELLKNNLPQKEFDSETQTFTEEGFKNNLAYLNATIEVNDGFTSREVQSLTKLKIFRIWELANSESTIRDRLHNHFTCEVILPIQFTKDQKSQLKKRNTNGGQKTNLSDA